MQSINLYFQVENILRSDRGDFVLCDYGSATRRVVHPQVSLKRENKSCEGVSLRLNAHGNLVY